MLRKRGPFLSFFKFFTNFIDKKHFETYPFVNDFEIVKNIMVLHLIYVSWLSCWDNKLSETLEKK